MGFAYQCTARQWGFYVELAGHQCRGLLPAGGPVKIIREKVKILTAHCSGDTRFCKMKEPACAGCYDKFKNEYQPRRWRRRARAAKAAPPNTPRQRTDGSGVGVGLPLNSAAIPTGATLVSSSQLPEASNQ